MILLFCMSEQNKLDSQRHSLAHLLAAAVMEIWPDTLRTIGPAIDNGFYYDFEFSSPISDNDLTKIEKKMRSLLPNWKEFSHQEVSAPEARELFKNNPYKLELINDIVSGKLGGSSSKSDLEEEPPSKITLYCC